MLSPSIEMSYASPQSLTISDDSSSDDYRRSPPVVRPRPSPRNYAVATDYDTLLPLKNCKYFPPRTRQSETVVGVVIPFFNEGKAELERTLESLYDQQVECGDLGVEFLYLAVMDGILMADPTMVEYISSLYKTNEWADKMYMSEDTEYITVLHAAANDDADSSHGLVEIAPGKHLRLTFLIKGQNRRKTNSHEWFFVAYCREYEVDYAFATDCGTLYANGCLYYLIQYLSTHPEVSAVTGRQRVMSSTMQSLRTEGLMQMWYRAVQSYDYEASISSFLGAFSLMGMLPVIPGPAGLWRMSDCGGAPMDYYINYINNISAEDGLIKGNLLLAEDRILSYAVCLMTGKYTRWVPMAVFYTEAETDIKSFITQRRRWINGTMACYIFLLFASPGILFRGPHRLGFKLMIYSQLLIQTLLFGVTALSPGIFATLICFSVDTLHIGGAEWSRTIALTVAGISLCMYIIFCGLHFFHKFVRSFYEYLLIWNTVTFSVIVANVVVSFANKDVMTIVVLLLVVFFPFFLALLHSLDVFVMMLFSFFQFFLFLPTFLPYFSAYSYCRIWDLSWGNRPSSSSSENKESIEVVTDTAANSTSAGYPAKKKMADDAHPKIDSRFDRSESVDTQSSEVNSWQSSSTFGSRDYVVPITSAKTKIENGTKIAKGDKIDLSKVKYNEFSSADIASQTRMVSAADDRVAKKAGKKNRQRRTLSTKRKHRLMGLLILLIVMVANVLVAGVFIWTEQMNALMILTLGLVGMALCQQILSFLFYLFYSEHMITAGVQSMSRNWTKLLSATLFITTIVCLYTGALTTHWLTNSIDIYLPGNGTYVLNNTMVAHQGPVESEVDSMVCNAKSAFLLV
ncbi:hypothetical protein SARC_09652 [Sphaeroforma arctica JP610]|uniref:chitin synthase n=1 Tax=Sphaeroforma arctica JP610 TaxID=667725 RepID=A0A0L0FMB3_9EUKA|nr:hypothetical protein SARC_09652 [Sphaeroforma arctica JP610]KNC77895.1 hypothetical protein SARC_09652 [Sphaeroforma arctica JP610]|eukprot:XP_014151797.1 hypothetical protein SARC_09652 [Sphaeroforma arctica JP610]